MSSKKCVLPCEPDKAPRPALIAERKHACTYESYQAFADSQNPSNVMSPAQALVAASTLWKRLFSRGWTVTRCADAAPSLGVARCAPRFAFECEPAPVCAIHGESSCVRLTFVFGVCSRARGDELVLHLEVMRVRKRAELACNVKVQD